MAYKRRINHVTHGSQATAGNVSTATRELAGNVEYLKSLIDGAFTGQAVFAREQTLESGLLVGQPVYFDAADQTFRPAIAAAATANGQLIAAETAEVIGIVYEKQADTQGDILLLGFAEVDLSNAIDGDVTAGRYYLSGTTAGKLVRSRPAATVAVLYAFGNGKVLVAPAVRDFLEDHIHYSFNLVCQPAGTHVPPSPGDTHAITNPDADMAGWLPANHSSFGGNAPDGAAFGYNLAADDALFSVWPPIPLSGVGLIWDKGADHLGGTDVPIGMDGLVYIDQYGIWWMSNCYGDVPWPTDYTAPLQSSSESLECPRSETMRLRLDFVRMAFANNRNAVTSLKSLSPAIEIVDCNYVEASIGDLFLRLTLSLLVSDDDTAGDLALKDFDPDTQTFTRGPLVEKIVGGTGVIVTATRTTVADDVTSHQGTVTISVDSLAGGREISPELVRVDDMPDRYDGNIAYLAFMDDQQTGLRARFNIPPSGLGDSPSVKLRVLLYAAAAGTLPTITLTTRSLSRPTGTPVLPSGDTSRTFDVPAAGTVAAGDYFEVESEAFSVAAGDTIFLSLSRDGDDGYDGELGLLRMGLILQ